jgi:hypothetical protein
MFNLCINYAAVLLVLFSFRVGFIFFFIFAVAAKGEGEPERKETRCKVEDDRKHEYPLNK